MEETERRGGNKEMRREGGVSRGREREWEFGIMVSLFNLGDLDFVFMDFSTLLMSFILGLIILGGVMFVLQHKNLHIHVPTF